MQTQDDEKYKPLYALAKRNYLNLKKLNDMRQQVQSGGNANDDSYKPLYALSKRLYLDMKELKKIEHELGL